MINKAKSKKGFTLVEIAIVVAIIAVLAALIGAALPGIRGSSVDTTKVSNAEMLSDKIYVVWENGGNTAFANAGAAIAALDAGIAVVPGPGIAPYTVAMDRDVNPAAYTYVAAAGAVPPSFTPILGEPNVRP